MSTKTDDRILLPLNNITLINNHWLTEILSNYYDCECSVKSFKTESPLPHKEGYLSEIAYISVVAQVSNRSEKIEHLVIKCLPNDTHVRHFINTGKLAEREVKFYNFAQTEEFKLIVKRSGLTMCVPEVIYSVFKDCSCFTLVMKNLKTLGYKTILLREGSTLKHTLKAFSSLAIIHTAGLFYFQKYGRFGVEKYSDTSLYDQYLVPNLERLSELFEGTPFSENFQKMIPYATLLRNYHLRASLFETVIHGDLWAGQCMFSENEEEVCILDWQFSTVGSPIIDLMGMFFMSCDPCIMENHLSQVLEHYWKELTDNLKKSNIPFSISYDSLVDSVNKNWMAGFLFILVSLNDFLAADNITDKRLRGLMNFLYRRKVFQQFIQECQSMDSL